MSRTIRKGKFGNVYADGKERKEPFYCNCWLCTGTNGQEVKEKKEAVADKYIKDTVRNYHSATYFCNDEEEYWEELGTSLQEERNWIEYQEAA